jgi:hypothetical protein
MSDLEPGWLADFIREVDPQHKKQVADNAINFARMRFKKVMERIFENEVAKVKALIQEPARCSGKEWEKLMTDFEWAARRLACVAETMEELRPLVRIDDAEDEPARVTVRRLLAESFME